MSDKSNGEHSPYRPTRFTPKKRADAAGRAYLIVGCWVWFIAVVLVSLPC